MATSADLLWSPEAQPAKDPAYETWMFAENQEEGIFGDSFAISLAGLPTEGAAGLPGHWECLVGGGFLSVYRYKMYRSAHLRCMYFSTLVSILEFFKNPN